MSKPLFLTGAGIFLILGLTHALLLLSDFRWPRALVPTDNRVRDAMRAAPLRLAPQTTIWRSWLGFNLSHSLGLVVFGLLLGGLAIGDFGAVAGNAFVRFTSVTVSALYTLLAVRFWFWAPATAAAIGTACFLASALGN